MGEIADTTEVIIIGGGPAGLVSAMLLTARGIDVQVFERRQTMSDFPRAHLLNLRTMEIFRELGFDDEVYRLSPPEDQWHRVAWRTPFGDRRPQHGKLLGSVPAWGGGPDRERYRAASPARFSNVPQIRLDPVLREQAGLRLPGRILYGYEAVAIEQDDAGATVTVVGPDGTRHDVRGSYVIAGDGGAFVPGHLGVTMEGQPAYFAMVTTRFEADLRDLIPEEDVLLHYVIDPIGQGTFRAVLSTMGPIEWGRLSREWVLHQGMPLDDPRIDDDEAIRAGVLDVLSVPAQDVTMHAISRWALEGVVAEKYRVGRVFLMGNSAHRHPPMGGLGLNTAVQDAHNLAWKLAAVLREGASDALLDTYESERKPVGEFNVKHSVTNTTGHARVANALGLFSGQAHDDGWAEIDVWMSDTAAGRERREAVDAAIASNSDDFSQLNVEVGFAYEDGALVPDGTEPPATHGSLRDFTPSARPGHHLPHTWLDEAQARSTFDLVERGGLTLLVPESGAAAWSAAGDVPGVVVRAMADDVWATVSGVGVRGALLVRPDRHVAWRAAETPGDVTAAVADVADEVLRRRSARA